MGSFGRLTAGEDLPELDSAEFQHIYEGKTVLEKADPAWLLSESGVGNQWEVIDGDFHFQSSAEEDEANYVFWVLPDPEWANFSRQKGFTLEVGMKPDPEKSLGINLAAMEEVGAGYAVLKVGEDTVEWAQGTGEEMMVLSSENNRDGFHAFRIVKLPSLGGEAGLFNIYRDGVLIGEELGGAYVSEKISANRLFIGDVGTWDGGGSISFIRWDTTDAYAPEKK
jgi:hypothetical protein